MCGTAQTNDSRPATMLDYLAGEASLNCADCGTLITTAPTETGHAALYPVGMPVRADGAGGGWAVDYRCRTCACRWHFRLPDSGEPRIGFSLGRF